MNHRLLRALCSGVFAYCVSGGSSASAQVKVFLDVPKIQIPPQAIIDDAEFTDAADDPAADILNDATQDPPVGKLKIDVAPGEIIHVPVIVQDGEDDLISYALRVQYNKKILKVLEVQGGAFAGFADPPLTNRASFVSGKTDFTANNAAFAATPDNFNIAVVSFEVIGKPKQKGAIAIRKTPKTDLTLLRTFGPARQVQFQKGIMVRVK